MKKFFFENYKVIIFFSSLLLFGQYIFLIRYEGSGFLYNKLNLIYILIIILLNILPLLFYIFNKNEKSNLPIFYLSLIFFFFTYTLAIVVGDFSNHYAPLGVVIVSEDHAIAIQIYLIALFFFNIGYFIFFKFIKKNRDGFTILDIEKNSNLLLLGFLTLLGVILVYYILDLPKFINGILQIKYPLLYFSYGLLTLYIANNQKKTSWILLFVIFGLILTPVFIDLLSGAYLTPFISLFLILIFYYYLNPKIFNKKIILMIILLISFFLLIIPIKHEYRQIIKNDLNLNVKEKVVVYVKAISSQFNHFNYKTINSIFINRVFHSYDSLVIVISQSPEKVDFWRGESYKILSSKIIPRIFWKDKPSDTLANTYGHRYGVLNKDDFNTSWNMPVLNEFYLNFGIPGVSIGMFLLGILFRFFSTYLSIKTNNIEKIISFFILVPLFFLEIHLSLLFGAVLQSYIFLIVFYIIYKKIFKFLKII